MATRRLSLQFPGYCQRLPEFLGIWRAHSSSTFPCRSFPLLSCPPQSHSALSSTLHLSFPCASNAKVVPLLFHFKPYSQSLLPRPHLFFVFLSTLLVLVSQPFPSFLFFSCSSFFPYFCYYFSSFISVFISFLSFFFVLFSFKPLFLPTRTFQSPFFSYRRVLAIFFTSSFSLGIFLFLCSLLHIIPIVSLSHSFRPIPFPIMTT